LVEVAAKQEAAKRIKAVTLLQSRMRGMLAGLAVGRNQQELHATYTLRTDATFVVQLPGQPPRRLTATVVSGQARDMRKGLMLRIASKDAGLGGREEGNMVPRQTGKVERDRVYYATISELITLLRGQPPRELRTPLKLQQVYIVCNISIYHMSVYRHDAWTHGYHIHMLTVPSGYAGM
jgi:hypothetical protein